MQQRRRLFTLLVALIFSVLAYAGSTLLVPPTAAYAHAFVIGSNPVDGATIDAVPSVVRIYFDAPISKLSSAHVLAVSNNGQNTEVNAAASSVSPTNPRELDTPIKTPKAQPSGSYEVNWTAIANDDGQATSGVIGFNVGYASNGLSGTTILGPSSSNDLAATRTLNAQGALRVLWEWFALSALLLWVGVVAFEQMLVAGGGRTLLLFERVQKQTISLQWLCLSALLLSDIVNMLLNASNASKALQLNAFDLPTLARLIGETSYGYIWIARIVLVVLAMLLLGFKKRPHTPAPQPEPTPRKVGSNAAGPLRQYVTGELRTVTTASLPKEMTERERAASIAKERTARENKDKSTKDFSQEHANAIQRYGWLTLPIAGLLLLTQTLTGDAAQVIEPRISAIVFSWLNLGAEALWFGGLAYLCYLLLPSLAATERDHHTEILSALLRRLTPYLIGATSIAVLSQLFLSEASVSNPGAFLSDPYGRTLLIQIILVVILLALSLYTIFVLRPRLSRLALLLPVVNLELPARRRRQTSLDQSRQKLRTITGTQAWLGAGVLLCCAFMSFFAPPIVFPNTNYGTTTNNTSGQTAAQTQNIGNLTATLLIAPGTTRTQNTAILTLSKADGTLVTNAKVQLTTNMQAMNMGTSNVTLSQGNPTYTATFDKNKAFNMAGLWVINTTIQQPGQPPQHTLFKITIS
ncbi:MAG TPA: copper resistance protein CopC [Ktedonobacteraceae bacterium]|nr:copper resistance protein CopC [Ktedonobacteraceae bacterium]